MPRVATLNAGTSRRIMPLSKMIAASRAALVGLEELDDRVAAGLLLAVAAEADVDRQLAGPRELARGGEQHVELALVVDRAAPVEVAVADLGLERIALPELERVGRLHVEVAVAEDGRRARRRRRGADLADRERLAVPVDELALAAGVADERRRPTRPRARRRPRARGSALIEGMRRNSASSSNQSAPAIDARA